MDKVKSGTPSLSHSDKLRFQVLEEQIDQGLQAFLKVGEALAEIKEKKLYREEFKNFSDYCNERFKFSRAHAYRMIEAIKVRNDISNELEGDIPLPNSESQLREIKKLPPGERAQVWERVVKDDSHFSAKALKDIVSEKIGEEVKNDQEDRVRRTIKKLERLRNEVEVMMQEIENLKSKELADKVISLYQEINELLEKIHK